MQHRREESVFTCIASPPPPNEQTCLEDYDTNLSLTGQHSPRPLSPCLSVVPLIVTHPVSSLFFSCSFPLCMLQFLDTIVFLSPLLNPPPPGLLDPVMSRELINNRNTPLKSVQILLWMNSIFFFIVCTFFLH